MTCLLKRVLPFALTLTVGLMLGIFFNKCQRSIRVAEQKQSGYAEGRGFGHRLPFNPREVDRKARVLTRPEPQYTEEARENLVEGTVVLRAIFSEDGVIRDIRVMSGLPHGLTERAVEAARQIEFMPAVKDGQYVPQYIQIEYNFNLY